MTTIPLTEALQRVTKGRLYSPEHSNRALWSDSKDYVAVAQMAADAALLAHCWNELPALVEACVGLFAHYRQLCEELGLDADEQEPLSNLRTALHRAQTVKMI